MSVLKTKNFIALDTAYERGIVALAQENKIIHHCYLKNQLSHGTQICGALQQCCEKAQELKISLDFVAVGLGPGSFVGLRVGLATGLGFCFGKNIPIIGFCTHQALANNFLPEHEYVCLFMKASRGFYYYSIFSRNNLILSPRVISFEEIKNKIDQNYFVVSNCILVQELLESVQCEIILGCEARGVIQTVTDKMRNFGFKDESNFITPNYVKPPNARVQKIQKIGCATK